MSAVHTDIALDGWIGRLPSPLVPYALLARLDRPIGSWLLFLPGLWAILLAGHGPGALWLIVAFALGSVLMRGAGCVVNDIWDRDLDRRVSRTTTRPLASGALHLRHAALALFALCLPSLGILLTLDPLAQVLGVGSLVLVALYPAAKRVTSWPQIVLGLTFGWGAPMGYAAASGRLDAAGLALYGVAIVWTLGYDTVYAHQDREDDTLLGLGSTARVWGENTRPFLAACYGAALLLLALAGWLSGLGWGFWAGLSLPAVLLVRQVVRLDIHDAPLCLALFKSNRDVGLAVALAILLGRLW